MAGELADGWYPFLHPRHGIADARTVLAAARPPGAPAARIWTVVPAFVDDDPDRAAAAAAESVASYLARAGPRYREGLSRFGHGAAVAAAAAGVRSGAVVGLTDSLTVYGTADLVRAGLRAWHRDGATMPVIALPSGASIEQLVATVCALAPLPAPGVLAG